VGATCVSDVEAMTAQEDIFGPGGGASNTTMPRVLDELAGRLRADGLSGRRLSRRGLLFYRVLELAVSHPPVRYQDLIATKRPSETPPTPPQTRGHPPSLESPPANRPWRTT